MNMGSRTFRGRGISNGNRTAGESSDVGNRKSFDEVKVPPDNIGNKFEMANLVEEDRDGRGNSLEEEPSHLKSGILASISLTEKSSNFRKRTPYQMPAKTRLIEQTPAENMAKPSMSLRKANFVQSAEQYFTRLNQDFAKLLKERSGMPFAFSMKAFVDKEAREALIDDELNELFSTIEKILAANSISASVKILQYKTDNHHFAVFFIKPSESDAVRNKELIAALRQVVNGYAKIVIKSSINVFLVLANAQSVIEEHLLKMGAHRIEDDVQ